MKTKCLAVGIILLFIGANIAVMGNSTQKTTKVMQDTPFIEHTPDDGLYWNDRKIAEYPVLFFLHYYFKFKATFPIIITVNSGGIGCDKVEIYFNGVLQETITGPGPVYVWPFEVTVTPFHHSLTGGIKVYLISGEVLSDNVTVYRLFP
jgi:hypothetical protein